jgi:phosphatidate cytidylyltransferase
LKIFGYHIPEEIIYVLAYVYAFLIIAISIFYYNYKKKKTDFFKELYIRTKSWWILVGFVVVLVVAPKLWGTILMSYFSFVAAREMFSIGLFREGDRYALFVAYLTIPVQYYFAYNYDLMQFLNFIPFFVFIGLPTVLIMSGKVSKIGRSMAYIPAVLMFTTYTLSHLVLLYGMKFSDFSVGPGGLILFLIMVTEFNDVFQFTWGKMVGKTPILPTVSPNKTWEGFVGGILTTAIFAFALRFLTPLDEIESLIAGVAIGITGFIGDAMMSAMKRDLRIKDTDDIIPGHGGAMDRLDSLIVTAPTFFYILIYLG